MRIGILTQPLGQNYGGILQNFALQIVLKRMGHDPITLRVGKRTVLRWLFSCCKSIIRLLACKGWAVYESPVHMNHRLSGMERFIKKHMNVTPTCFWYSARLVRKNKIELLLVGSDQTWRPNYNLHIEDLYLGFAGSLNIPGVAYATSFGTSGWEYDKEQTIKCGELIKRFRAVSVREKSGMELCHKYLNYDNAEWVLDPTLLLSREDYEAVCSNIPQQVPFLFAYILDTTEEKKMLCKRLAQQKKLPLYFVSAGEGLQATDSPERWLASFRDAAFVVTDSFHGTVFSLIFHCDFITLYNAERGNTRFDSLVKQFGISQRITNNHFISIDNLLPVDWNILDKQWMEWKEKSLNFLEENIY